MSSEPKRLSPEDFAAPTRSPRLRGSDDPTPEELDELARQQAARRALLERGRTLAARLSEPEEVARREREQHERERAWARKAPVRARERGVPIDDHDVRRYALDPQPVAGQALDAVRAFLAWREATAERERGDRCKGLFVLLSPPGGGKSTAGAWAVVWHRESALYLTAAEVAANPLTAHTTTHLAWRTFVGPDLVVVDEIGTERDAATVLALAQERYNRGRATILLGNLTSEEFFARYPDPRLESRLQQQSARGGPTLLELTCGDLRLVAP